MNKLLVSLALLSLILSACGKHDNESIVGPAGAPGAQGNAGIQGAQGPEGPAATPPAESAPQQVIDQQNLYRASVGQEPLTQGLNCTLYTVPNTTTQIVGATLTNIGSFEYLGDFNVVNSSVTVGLPILPLPIQPDFQTWIVLKCTGTLAVADNAWHNFALTSDDGANLYIDGLLVNNDGLHSVQTVSKPKFLQYGVHSFEVDFFQGAGMQALILQEDGNIMNNNQFFH